MVSTSTRFKIIGAETFAVGAFLLLTFLLSLSGTSASRWLPSVDSDLPIVGGALVFVGLETFSLIKHLPSPPSVSVIQRASTDSSATGVREGRLISVRKLVALDVALHGRRLILLEFGISAPSMVLGGLFIMFTGYWPLGAYLVMLGINYVPLLAYAAALKDGHGELANRSRSGMSRTFRRFGVQQALILVPFAIPILAILQRSVRHA